MRYNSGVRGKPQLTRSEYEYNILDNGINKSLKCNNIRGRDREGGGVGP